MENTFDRGPMRSHHIDDILRIIDEALAEESAQLEEIHTTVEQNGSELSEETLVWDAFHPDDAA